MTHDLEAEIPNPPQPIQAAIVTPPAQQTGEIPNPPGPIAATLPSAPGTLTGEIPAPAGPLEAELGTPIATQAAELVGVPPIIVATLPSTGVGGALTEAQIRKLDSIEEGAQRNPAQTVRPFTSYRAQNPQAVGQPGWLRDLESLGGPVNMNTGRVHQGQGVGAFWIEGYINGTLGGTDNLIIRLLNNGATVATMETGAFVGSSLSINWRLEQGILTIGPNGVQRLAVDVRFEANAANPLSPTFLPISGETNGPFRLGEILVDSVTGASGRITGRDGNTLILDSTNGTFGNGNTVSTPYADTRLQFSNGLNMPFTLNAILIGNTSSASGRIKNRSVSSSGEIVLDGVQGPFQVGETIQNGSATAQVDNVGTAHATATAGVARGSVVVERFFETLFLDFLHLSDDLHNDLVLQLELPGSAGTGSLRVEAEYSEFHGAYASFEGADARAI